MAMQPFTKKREQAFSVPVETAAMSPATNVRKRYTAARQHAVRVAANAGGKRTVWHGST